MANVVIVEILHGEDLQSYNVFGPFRSPEASARFKSKVEHQLMELSFGMVQGWSARVIDTTVSEQSTDIVKAFVINEVEMEAGNGDEKG